MSLFLRRLLLRLLLLSRLGYWLLVVLTRCLNFIHNKFCRLLLLFPACCEIIQLEKIHRSTFQQVKDISIVILQSVTKKFRQKCGLFMQNKYFFIKFHHLMKKKIIIMARQLPQRKLAPILVRVGLELGLGLGAIFFMANCTRNKIGTAED